MTTNTEIVDYLTTLFEQGSPATVRFTKKDGTERTMICTKNMEFIPEEHHPKKKDENAPVRKKNDNLFVVFDLQKNEWRSFLKESIISVEYQSIS